LKIVLAVRYFRPVGGMEKFTLNLARFLVERGHRVRAIAFEGDPMPGVEFKRIPLPFGMLRPMRDWMTAQRLAKVLDGERDADVIYGEQKMWGCDVLRPAGGVEDEYWKAHVRYRHPNLDWPEAFRHISFKHALDVDAEQRGMRDPRLRRVIVNSDLIRRQLLLHYPFLRDRIDVIHEGISPAPEVTGERLQAERPAFLARFGLNPTAPTALFVGHDFRRKGLRQAIQVIAEIRRRRPQSGWQLLVVGRDRPASFRALARKLGIASSVAFAGTVFPADSCFGAADALLFPTLYDPFANVTLESLAFGVPVITTRQNGGSEVIESGVNGWVVPEAGAIGDLATALERVIEPDRRAALRRTARDSAMANELTGKLEAVEAVLQAVAAERRRSPKGRD
jgi:UDP-glucose:(heptosyl)LPS alpha-1,3-glucosyltransferase